MLESPDLAPLAYSLVALSLGLTITAAITAAFSDQRAWIQNIFFPILGLSAISAVIASACLLADDHLILTAELPFGLPWLNWHLRFDALGAYFFGLLGIVLFAVCCYGPTYIREYAKQGYSMAVLGIATALFILGMQLVILANDAFSFMIAWELMSVSSYILVVFEHKKSANRRAGFLYLLMASVSALTILLAFGVLAAFSEDFTFDAYRQVTLSPGWATVAFALATLGFGLKAGLFPLHVWLPEAHPVAPSHISALMSGVMLKIAIYGFIRFVFEFIKELQVEWGVVLILLGSVTALYGVLYALIQDDIKRLLAYSSVENIGIIFIGIGLAVLFKASNLPQLAVLGLIAALYHALNHAIFKSLLFLGAGVILQYGHQRNLEHMGGLINRMPWTAGFFLIGCISISALPPFNGFASEWLTFQTMLQATALGDGVLRSILPISAAMLALTGAIAAACFVKVFGIGFLGQARTKRVKHAHEGTTGMAIGQGILALLCLLTGIFPTFIVDVISTVTLPLIGTVPMSATHQGWLWLTPIDSAQASYGAPLVFACIAIAFIAWFLVFITNRGIRKTVPVPRVDAWESGFGRLTSRMQYSAAAFAMPIKTIFEPIFEVDEQVVKELDESHQLRPVRIQHHSHAGDIAWRWLYLPIEKVLNRTTSLVAKLQSGYLRHYLGYSLFTLLFLLWIAI